MNRPPERPDPIPDSPDYAVGARFIGRFEQPYSSHDPQATFDAKHDVPCDILRVRITRKTSISGRVEKHRAGLRSAVRRPAEIWVSDARRPEFAEECLRQSLLVAASASKDAKLTALMDSVLEDIEGCREWNVAISSQLPSRATLKSCT
jgi:hypothetical protein